jgi:hypothetical protein
MSAVVISIYKDMYMVDIATYSGRPLGSTLPCAMGEQSSRSSGTDTVDNDEMLAKYECQPNCVSFVA